jgi:hypothetical protein
MKLTDLETIIQTINSLYEATITPEILTEEERNYYILTDIEPTINQINEAKCNEENTLNSIKSGVFRTLETVKKDFNRKDIEPEEIRRHAINIYKYSFRFLLLIRKGNLLKEGKRGKITISNDIKERISRVKQITEQIEQQKNYTTTKRKHHQTLKRKIL